MLRQIILLAILLPPSTWAAEAISEDQFAALVSDVSVFEGQFYSVLDYCSPHAGEPVTPLTVKSWQSANAQLLKDRDQLVEDFIKTKDLDTEKASALRQTVQGFIDRARRNDRLYKDLNAESDKFLPCSKRLGAMNSSSMSFKSIAPASYQIWQKYRGL